MRRQIAVDNSHPSAVLSRPRMPSVVMTWKLVAAKGDPWELYDLGKDVTETNDLAGEHPGRVRKLEKVWDGQWKVFQKMARRGLTK